MKWSNKIAMLFMALLTTPELTNAQAPVARPVAAPAASAVAAPVDPATTATSTVTTPPADVTLPTTGTPANTGTATTRQPVSWSTAVLRDSILKSIVDPKPPKKKKGKRLSDSKIEELRTKIAKKPKDTKSRLQLAEHFEASEKPGEMIEVLRPGSENLDREGLLALARAYRAKEDYLQEARVLQQQLAENPNDYVVQTLLGDAYLGMKNVDKAVDSFLEARRVNPKYLPAYEALLRENLKNNQSSDAISTAQEMIENFGESGKILGQLCLLYADQAFLDKAVETCKAAIAKDPKKPENHVFLGLAMREKDGDTAAVKIIQSAAKQFQKSEVAQYVAGEFFYSSMKNGLAAVKYFRQAVKNDNKSARSLLGLARSSFDEKDYVEALENFVAACKINRTMISDFRKSTGLLRRDGKQSSMATRFERGMSECGYR